MPGRKPREFGAIAAARPSLARRAAPPSPAPRRNGATGPAAARYHGVMRPWPAALLLAFALPAAAAERELHADWLVDGSITGAALIGLGVLRYGIDDDFTPPSDDGAPPGGIDRLSPLKKVDAPAKVSDVLLWGSLGLGATTVVLDGLQDERLPRHLLLYVEALALNGLATEGVKRLVSRPRPYTYDQRTGDRDDDLSFWSGHSSWTACASLGAARIVDLSSDLSTGTRVAMYGGASALTLTVMSLRVAGGRHFPTDVLAGGLTGAAIGLGLPSLHLQDTPTVTAGGGGAMLSFGGHF